MNNGYGICLNEWLTDNRIKNELRLLIRISSLLAENGQCIDADADFAYRLNISEKTVSRHLKKLHELGYINVGKRQTFGGIEFRDISLTI